MAGDLVGSLRLSHRFEVLVPRGAGSPGASRLTFRVSWLDRLR